MEHQKAPYPPNFRCTMGEAPYQQQQPVSQVSVQTGPMQPSASSMPGCPCMQKQQQRQQQFGPTQSQSTCDSPNYIDAYMNAPAITSGMASSQATLECKSSETKKRRRRSKDRFKTQEDRCPCSSEDEFYSLSSSDKEDDIGRLAHCQGTASSGKTMRSTSPDRFAMNDRHAVILSLLQEVVHLIDDTSKSTAPTACTTESEGDALIGGTKMRKLGNMDDSKVDGGPFTSNIRISIRSCKGELGRFGGENTGTELSDAPPQPIPMQCPPPAPCNLFIAPNMQGPPIYVLPFAGQQPQSDMPPAGVYPPIPMDGPSYSGWKPGQETIHYGMDETPAVPNVGESICPALGVVCQCMEAANQHHLQQPLPPHGYESQLSKMQMQPSQAAIPLPDSSQKQDFSYETEERPSTKPEVTFDEPSYEEEMTYRTDMKTESSAEHSMQQHPMQQHQRTSAGDGVMGSEGTPLVTANDITADYESDIICEEIDLECQDEQRSRREERRRQRHAPQRPSSEDPNAHTSMPTDANQCDCCHCRAMRDVNAANCLTIATPKQAERSINGCDELKYFIDSIIMDLDAMEHARRKKRIEQNLCCPKKPSVCPRQSFPVTIVEVTDLGATSLFVKWIIHDCFGIGGYEIYVDGYLTNRYFHCNHEAAVVCDVDVTKAHKIVLVAQPKLGDSADNVLGCTALLRKSDANKLDKKGVSELWTPSIYLYDPMQRQTASPINRCSC